MDLDHIEIQIDAASSDAVSHLESLANAMRSYPGTVPCDGNPQFGICCIRGASESCIFRTGHAECYADCWRRQANGRPRESSPAGRIGSGNREPEPFRFCAAAAVPWNVRCDCDTDWVAEWDAGAVTDHRERPGCHEQLHGRDGRFPVAERIIESGPDRRG